MFLESTTHPKVADLSALLQALVDADVEFIVVGGAAAVLHGAPVTTQDVDIVPSSTPENIRRLADVLEQLNAVIREVSNRGLRPTVERLSGRGQLLLSTRLGPLDCLLTLHDGRGYEELRSHIQEVNDGALHLEILDLETLIRVKTEAGRAKDRIMVPILLALLKRQQDA